MEPTRIYLKDYTAPAYELTQVELFFNLFEEKAIVTNKMFVKKIKDMPFELDGIDLKLISISLSGKTLAAHEYEIKNEKLILNKLPSEFTLEIQTELKPQENTALEGLYKSNGIFCTQCEAQSFRKITYFPDRPDMMSSYTVLIEADEKKYPVLLSNGDRISVKSIGQGRHQALWKDPHKKPSYLFALVAGDLGVIQDHFTTKSGRQVLLEVFALHGQQDRCHHAMDSLKKSMKWDEERFGREYDLNNYMIVAVDDFNAGAMENKGLNIFNSRLVLADSKIATDADYQAIESVVAHEYFHNWTGNRVTLRDWFQLSLKEGLTVFRDQEFSADMTDRGLQRISDVDALRERQFSEDAGPNAHPVRPESCISVDNFFTPTIYEKGAELIRMMQILTGRKGFRQGMDLYFKRHDGQAVTTDDFAAAIADANKLDFSQFKLWYQQSGTPQIYVQEKFDAKNETYELTLKQECKTESNQAEKKPFHIPILFGLLNSQGEEISIPESEAPKNSDGESVLHLKEKKQTFIFRNMDAKPIPSLFREFSSPICLHWEAPLEDLLIIMQKDRDGFNRREIAQKVYLDVFKSMLQGKSEVPENLLKVLQSILQDQKMSLGFKAQMLSLPSDMMVTQSLETINATKLKLARVQFQRQIALYCENELKTIYKKLNLSPLLNQISLAAFEERSLKNQVLSLLASLDSHEIKTWISDQYFKSQNMTDHLSALTLLVDSEHEERKRALDDFLNEFKSQPVVLNKWFTVQALSTQSNTFNEVKSLIHHPSFQIQNPNNVYALLRSFGNNIPIFHDPSQNTYEFYLEMIKKIDEKNPQAAARLCAAFNIYKKLDTEMLNRLKKEISKILLSPNLSKNTRELLMTIA